MEEKRNDSWTYIPGNTDDSIVFSISMDKILNDECATISDDCTNITYESTITTNNEINL